VRLLRLLQKLEKDRRLIVAVEIGYRFDHNIVYEVVYGGILPELRVEYHRLAADILRKSDDIHSVIYDLVHHLRLAGEDRLALEYLPKACERARGEYSNRLALEQAAWGWEAYERLGKPEEFRPLVADLMAERAEVAGILGERSIEVESANRVLDLAGELDDTPRLSLAYRLLGEHARHISDFDRALEFYQKAYGKCLEEVGPRCAAILREMGSVRYLKGEDKKAIELYRQALDALAPYPTGPEHAKTHNNLGISLKRIGRTDKAVAEFETALAQAVELGDLHAETFPLGSLALIHYDAGRWEQAHELFLKLLNILEQTGDMVSRARTLLNLGNIFYQVGLYEQAEAYFEESLVARRRMEHRAGEALALHHLAHIDCERDDFDFALERLTEALTIYEEIGDKRGESGALAALARAHNHAGRHKVALQCADLALEIGRKGGFENRLAEARIESLLARLGTGAEKGAVAEEVKALAEGANFAMFVSQGPRALRRLMQLQDACGLEEESRRTREAAKEIVEKHLARLDDPEWRAGYRLLYKDLLQP
jgi:tetratricopeptide (TPR) repeat protein